MYTLKNLVFSLWSRGVITMSQCASQRAFAFAMFLLYTALHGLSYAKKKEEEAL